jgi:hypothetical protein
MQRFDCHAPVSPLSSVAPVRSRAHVGSLRFGAYTRACESPRVRGTANFGNFRAT